MDAGCHCNVKHIKRDAVAASLLCCKPHGFACMFTTASHFFYNKATMESRAWYHAETWRNELSAACVVLHKSLSQ